MKTVRKKQRSGETVLENFPRDESGRVKRHFEQARTNQPRVDAFFLAKTMYEEKCREKSYRKMSD